MAQRIDWLAVASHTGDARRARTAWADTEPFLGGGANVCTPTREEPETGPSATFQAFGLMATLLAIVGGCAYGLTRLLS